MDSLADDPATGRVRRREPVEKRITSDADVERNLIELTETRTAGDPDELDITFTDLTPTRLEEELAERGTPACDDTIRD